MLILSVVTDEEDHPLESGRRLSIGTNCQARVEGPKHHEHEDVLRCVQQAVDDANWTIDQDEFDDFLALKTDLEFSAVSRGFAGGFGSKFLFRP